MRRIFPKNIFLTITVVLSITACSSMHVNMTVQRPPAINTTGIRRIAIMPFTSSQNSALHREVAASLTNTAVSRIAASGHFSLVDSNVIERLKGRNESLEDHADALLVGQLISLNVRDSSRQVPRYNIATRSTVFVTIYDREVELIYSYSLLRARDSSLIGMVTRNTVNRDSHENRGSLRSASSLAQEIVANRMANIAQDLAPYTVTERRTLMDDRSERNLRTSMNNAFALVRTGNYRGALNMYLQIYDAYGNYPSIYNAALLYEIMGEAETAVELFEWYYSESGNPRALPEIARLQSFVAEQDMISEAYTGEVQTQRDRVLELALNEIMSSLPPDSRVWVYNNTKTEFSLANGVVLDLSAALMRNGITLVDRDTARLRAAEMELQMLGNVRDEDMISLGNNVGASVIIELSIEGAGSNRRLQLRMIDIERGIPIMTSDTNERWHI